MSRCLLRLVVVALLPLAGVAHAQVVLYPGHPDLSVEDLTVGDASRALWLDGSNTGLTTYTVDRDGDLMTMGAVAEINGSDVSRGSIVFEWPSLRPVTSQGERPGTDVSEITFEDTRVTGQVVSGDRPGVPFDLTLDQTPFQRGTIEYVARALPLREGYRAVALTFSGRQRAREASLSVVGPADVTLHDGTVVAAWAVDEDIPGRGGRTRRIYLDPDTRDLVAITTVFAGRDLLIEPTTREFVAARAAERERGEPLRPGSDGLAVESLRSGAQSYTLQIVSPEVFQQEIGRYAQSWSVEADRATLVVDFNVQGNHSGETVTVEYPSLRPLAETSVVNGAVTERVYTDGMVREMTPSDSTERNIERGVFGGSARLLVEVARLLPLEAGYQAQYQMDTPEGIVAVPLRVDGPAEIDGQPVWTVSGAPEKVPGVAGIDPFEVSFDAETRDLVRMVLLPPNGWVLHMTPEPPADALPDE